MKRISRIYLPLLAIIGLLVATASCKKEMNAETQRHIDNNTAFAEYEKNSEYRKVSMDGISGHVMMKWNKLGDGELYPISTSRVDVHYIMKSLIRDQVIEDNFQTETPTRLTIYRSETDRTIYGLAVALQNMVVGDECEVIIPWYMGFGSVGKAATATTAAVPSYTALRITIRLEGIVPEGDKASL